MSILLFVVGAALAETAPETPAAEEVATEKPMNCKQHKAEVAALKAEIEALDAELLALVAAAHEAPRRDRDEAMLAVMEAVVDQRTEIREKQEAIQKARMKHMHEHTGGGSCKKMEKPD